PGNGAPGRPARRPAASRARASRNATCGGILSVCVCLPSLLGLPSNKDTREPTRQEPMPPDTPKQKKIFVLDTSVILYDWNALQSFQEHDVAIPITVLEELDSFKKGNSVLNLQAREFIRQLDKLSGHNMLQEWIPLDGPAHGRFRVINEEDTPKLSVDA